MGATQVDAFGAMRRTSLQIPIILGSSSVAGLAQERTTTVKITEGSDLLESVLKGRFAKIWP